MPAKDRKFLPFLENVKLFVHESRGAHQLIHSYEHAVKALIQKEFRSQHI